MPAVIMPKMGDAMEEGTLLRWLKGEGEPVAQGDPIAEIENDKATVELTADDAGTLGQIVAKEGDTIPVGQRIAMILGEGESPNGAGDAQAAAGAATDVAAQAAQTVPPTGEGGETTHGGAILAVEQHTPPGETVEPTRPAGGDAPARQADGRATGAGGRIKASPLARRIAQEHDVDLSRITGSGPGGRIVREDVEAFLRQPQPQAQPQPPTPAAAAPAPAAPPAPAPVPTPTPAAATAAEQVPLTRMRAAIGRRMVESKTTIPHFYVSAEVDMTEALAWRKRLNETAAAEGYKVTVNDMIVKACGLALTKFPALNSSFAGDHIDRHANIDISIAVALPEGLIAPVVRGVDGKSVGRISREAADLVARAREGKLTPAEFSGGTFTVSNLGPYNVDTFIAIITPPQAAALAVGSSAQKAVVVGGEIVVRDRMIITISADHRVTDGAEGAQFVGEVRRLLENPLALLM